MTFADQPNFLTEGLAAIRAAADPAGPEAGRAAAVVASVLDEWACAPQEEGGL